MKTNQKTLNTRDKFLIGGLGGVMPFLLSLIVVDLEIILLKVTVIAVISYMLRAASLFTVGGLVSWLHKKETDPIKLFQLGIAAPALITAAINGGNIPLPDKSIDHNLHSSWGIVSQAYARTGDEIGPKKFALPRETAAQQFYRGLLSAIPRNVWFVIAGSHLTKEAAARQADKIRSKGFAADVYAPYGGNPNYAVVIGAQMTISKARALQRKAVAAGLPNDTYLWTIPQR